jgi:hypothetical protein
MSGENFENVDTASTDTVCGDDCVCEELFPQFTFACSEGEGYVPQHACDACKGYVWFDDKHGETCTMSIEQYEGLKRKEENDMLENLKHIWDDFEEDNEEQFTIDDNEDDEDDEDDEDNEDDEVQFTIDKKEGEEKLKI